MIFSVKVIIILCLCIFVNRTVGGDGSGVNDHTNMRSNEYKRAFQFLDNVQHGGTRSNRNDTCKNMNAYTVIDMNGWGGFASQFQQTAYEFTLALAMYDYTIPVLLRGHIRGYSDTQLCSHVKNAWTCYFLPLSICDDYLMTNGKKKEYNFKEYDISLVPSQFKHMGASWWWGLIQSYIFQLQPDVLTYIDNESSKMDNGKGFPIAGGPLIGIHVRHGDKSKDNFKDQSLDAEIAAVFQSPECKPHTVEKEIRQDNNTNKLPSMSDEEENMHHVCGKVNTTNFEPLRIFVASDDAAVLETSKKLGHLVDTAGVSQHTNGVGMLATLVNHNGKIDIGYNASLEIIADIYYLSKCSTLVGIAASQIYRMAVGMSNATGTLAYAIAMDYSQIPKITEMSRKYHVPFPETFAHPHR